MSRRVRRRLRGGRVVDFGGGHGLLAQVLLLLDDSSPSALVVDKALPPSSAAVHDALRRTWPRLAFVARAMDHVPVEADDVVVSSHACGLLTDRVLDVATGARARVAVLPCCHDLARSTTGDIAGWLDPALAIDVMRARRLAENGYRIWTQTIPAAITPKNRLLMGAPR
jgi:Methyltransferase domain